MDYSTFKQWVEEEKVEKVLMSAGKYTITLREGVEVELPEQEQDEFVTPDASEDEQSHPGAPSHPHPQLTPSWVLCDEPWQYELLVHV